MIMQHEWKTKWSCSQEKGELVERKPNHFRRLRPLGRRDADVTWRVDLYLHYIWARDYFFAEIFDVSSCFFFLLWDFALFWNPQFHLLENWLVIFKIFSIDHVSLEIQKKKKIEVCERSDDVIKQEKPNEKNLFKNVSIVFRIKQIEKKKKLNFHSRKARILLH